MGLRLPLFTLGEGWIESVAPLWLGSIARSAWRPWANWTRGENPKGQRCVAKRRTASRQPQWERGMRRREAIRSADIRYAPERKTRPSCSMQD